MELITHNAILFIAALFGGVMNAVAGGGSFFAFPALLFTGAPAVAANATCTIALWPGAVSSVIAFRKELRGIVQPMLWMIAIGVLGGWAGAMLLLQIEDNMFEIMIPWLLLLATLLFAYGTQLSRWMRRKLENSVHNSTVSHVISVSFQSLTALYGGFFGAGIGILTLAMLQLRGLTNMHQMNAMKVVLTVSINSSAFLTFVFSGIVLWQSAWVMVIGGMIGGYLGAHLSLKVSHHVVRNIVLAIAIALTLYFFVKYYLL